jgi:hypothetical protein
MHKFLKVLFIVIIICGLLVGCGINSPVSINTINTEIEKVTSEEALNIINKFIEEGRIQLRDPNCEVQYFFKNDKNYHIIRIAYIDPNNNEYTVTTARFWVSAETGDIYEEGLYTGDLNKIQKLDDESKIIVDIESWNHPSKSIFTDYSFKISKIELYSNDTYPVFYINSNKQITQIDDYNFLSDIAKANDYRDYMVVYDKNHIEVYCDKSNKKVVKARYNSEIIEYDDSLN